MKTFNLNRMARQVTLQEGGKVNLSIAQVKEVMRIAFKKLASLGWAGALRVLTRYGLKLRKTQEDRNSWLLWNG